MKPDPLRLAEAFGRFVARLVSRGERQLAFGTIGEGHLNVLFRAALVLQRLECERCAVRLGERGLQQGTRVQASHQDDVYFRRVQG